MKMSRRIKKRREELGLPQAGLARLVGVSTQAVQQWESEGEDQTTPRRSKRAKLALALKKTEAWLEFGDEAPSRAASAKPAPAALTPEAVDIALRWMTLSLGRQEQFRDAIFLMSYFESKMPFFKKGRPPSERYDQYERSMEMMFRQKKLFEDQ